jgi:hypothetical protein
LDFGIEATDNLIYNLSKHFILYQKENTLELGQQGMESMQHLGQSGTEAKKRRKKM